MNSTVIRHWNGGKHGLLTEGSLIWAERENGGEQAFIEEFSSDYQKVTIRTIKGEILKEFPLHRIYLQFK